VVLQIWDKAGRIGVGEASPLPGHSPDSLADCMVALDEIALRAGRCDADGWPLAPWLDALPAARFAWETALCDLIARARGVSVATLLGGQSLRAVPRNAMVASAAEAKQALAHGIRTLKVKVGRSQPDPIADADELAFLRSLRQELGDGFTLRLDANGVYLPDAARRRLQEFAALRPELVEQPTAPSELATLGRCAVPWAADESLIEAEREPARIDSLLCADGCAAWVLKPAALGLRRARELALLAQGRGLGVIITHLLDGPIALAAACELALSLPRAPWACGLDAHAGLSVFPPTDVPHHMRSAAEICESGGPGLGFPKEALPWT
jgi:L-alanine-DL-glutamate epimerase-like enolase superfamily enzyme